MLVQVKYLMQFLMQNPVFKFLKRVTYFHYGLYIKSLATINIASFRTLSQNKYVPFLVVIYEHVQSVSGLGSHGTIYICLQSFIVYSLICLGPSIWAILRNFEDDKDNLQLIALSFVAFQLQILLRRDVPNIVRKSAVVELILFHRCSVYETTNLQR